MNNHPDHITLTTWDDNGNPVSQDLPISEKFKSILEHTTDELFDVDNARITALEERVKTLEELLVIVLNNATNKEALELVQSYLRKHYPHYPHYHIGF